jgi:hypothetical protein
VGYGELVVYLVGGVAVEDYAHLVHDLLSRRIRCHGRIVGRWGQVGSALAAVV